MYLVSSGGVLEAMEFDFGVGSWQVGIAPSKWCTCLLGDELDVQHFSRFKFCGPLDHPEVSSRACGGTCFGRCLLPTRVQQTSVHIISARLTHGGVFFSCHRDIPYR